MTIENDHIGLGGETIASPVPTCQACARGPAVKATFRRATGLVLFHRTRTWHGWYCRECGLTLYRNAQSATLRRGWWGLTSLFPYTPVTLIANTRNGRKVRRLPTPIAVAQSR